MEIACEQCLLTPPMDKGYSELRATSEEKENEKRDEVGYFATPDCVIW